MFRIRMSAVVGAATVLLLTAVPLVGTAQAATVHCGQVITKTTTLTADVGPCQGDGIIIGADNITLNLNSHHIFGNAALQDGPGNRAGIRLPNRFGVHILGDSKRRSTVSEFDGGVAIIRGSGNVVEDVTTRDNIGPQQQAEPDLGDGIFVLSSNKNVIRNNTARHNGTFDGIGLEGVTSGNVIDGNNVVDNNVLKPSFFDKGIVLGPGATNNVVNNNTVRGSGPFGILVGQQILPELPPDFIPDPRTATPSVRNVITNNRLMHNGFLFGHPGPSIGILLANGATHSVVSGNTVTDTGITGMDVASDFNQIIRNDLRGNLGADLFDEVADLFAPFVALPPCGHNIYRANLFDEAFPDCIYQQQGLPVPPAQAAAQLASGVTESTGSAQIPEVPERRVPAP